MTKNDGEDERKINALMSNEDQLFFSLVLSLALLVITLPTVDFSDMLSRIFQFIGIDLKFPAISPFQTKILSILCLVSASVTRYASSVMEIKLKNRNAMTLRIASVESLFFAIYILYLELITEILLGLFKEYLLFVPSLFILFLIISHVGRMIEQKWLQIYYIDNQHAMPKPMISIIFFSVLGAFSFAIMLLIGTMIVLVILYGGESRPDIINLVRYISVNTFPLVWVLIIIRYGKIDIRSFYRELKILIMKNIKKIGGNTPVP